MTSPVRIGPRVIDADEEDVKQGVRGLASFGVQIRGTFVGTLQFEGTIDGETWVAVNMFPPNSTVAATSATATGTWLGHCGGLDAVRVRASAWTSGDADIFIQAAEGAGRF